MFGCYNYADNFLHLCNETCETHTCLPSRKLFYYGETLPDGYTKI